MARLIKLIIKKNSFKKESAEGFAEQCRVSYLLFSNITDIEGNKLGFSAKDYTPGVAIKPDETFMEYTQRMHKRIQERNREQQFQDLINEGTQRWHDKVSPPA